jgi:Cof subfamily protein (haloacid dehalogenase superfamily)
MRLVATDLDGTIVHEDGSISARTVAALQACQDAGVQVVYVTGRPARWMSQVVEQTGHRGTALCGNGAVVYDLDTECVLHAVTLDVPVLLDVADRLRAAMPQISFAVETMSGFRREPRYVARYDADLELRTGSLSELVDDDPGVLKLLCRDESSHADAMLPLATAVLDAIAVPTHSNPRDCLIEVSAPGINKAVALAALAAERGIERADVVAFGDMPNDLEMLAWAGRGYAVTGGHADVLAAASHTAPPLHEDGVAQVLEQLLAELAGVSR